MTVELDADGLVVSRAGRRRNGVWSLLLQVAVAVLMAVAAHPGRALAQATDAAAPPPPSDSPQLEVLATAYGWLPWVPVHVRPNSPALPTASTTVPPGKTISHLTWVPFMGGAEVRSSRWAFVADFIHAPLTGGIQTRGLLFGGGQTGLTINEGSGMFFYRALEKPNQSLDVGAGFRAWGFDGSLTLEPARLPAVSLSRGESWADPLLGMRYHIDLGNGFGATAYGDVGGFGAGAKVDGQVLASIDYKPKGWPVLSAGFRGLGFTYQQPLSRLNVGLYGPFLAAKFRF